MFTLVFTYVLLFVLAGLVGAGLGWSLRQFIVVRHMKILEADVGALRRARQAPSAAPRLKG